MSALSFKPLRKPVHLTQISDEEIKWKIADKERSSRHFCTLNQDHYRQLHSKLHNGDTYILPDAEGRIANILLTIPAHYDQKNPDVPINPDDGEHFRSLLKHLSAHKRKYTILCHASQIKTVKRWFNELGISENDYSLNISVFNYSIWAQDAYLALKDQNGRTLLGESVCFTRDHDMSVADDLAIQTEILRKQCYLYFQGGNVLQAGKYVLVGMDYIIENLGRLFLETEEKVLGEFRRLLGYPVIPVGRKELIPHKHRQYMGGGLFQPIFHIDMYVTPTGQKKKGKEVVFVGSPQLARKILNQKSDENDFDQYFDEAARQLSKYFEIIRMPLLPRQYKTHEMMLPRFYYITYNNALVEAYRKKRKKIRHVYLPSFAKSVKKFQSDSYIEQYYGDEKEYRTLDKAAKKIWESIGFKVFQVEAMEDLAMNWGSVHCMVKTIERSNE